MTVLIITDNAKWKIWFHNIIPTINMQLFMEKTAMKKIFYYRWKFCKYLNKLNISHDKISLNLGDLDCNQVVLNT